MNKRMNIKYDPFIIVLDTYKDDCICEHCDDALCDVKKQIMSYKRLAHAEVCFCDSIVVDIKHVVGFRKPIKIHKKKLKRIDKNIIPINFIETLEHVKYYELKFYNNSLVFYFYKYKNIFHIHCIVELINDYRYIQHRKDDPIVNDESLICEMD